MIFFFKKTSIVFGNSIWQFHGSEMVDKILRNCSSHETKEDTHCFESVFYIAFKNIFLTKKKIIIQS